jgi:DNA-binding CsgD family transcriptional regulator
MVALTNPQKQNFGKEFVAKYLAGGFGAMTKTEMDILIFHLISESSDIKGKSNYEVANKLLIPESKVKSLRLNSALKYNQANHKAVLANIVTRITEEMEKPEFESGKVTITIENPVEQRELEFAIKSKGRNIEHGLNKELFKISPIALFEIVVSNLENPEQEFTNVIQANVADAAKQAAIIDDTLTFRQKLNKVGEEINDKAGIIRLLGAVGGAL